MGALYTVITRNLCCSLCQAEGDSSFKGSAKKKQKTAMQDALSGLQDGNNGAKEIQTPQAKTAYLVSQMTGSCMYIHCTVHVLCNELHTRPAGLSQMQMQAPNTDHDSGINSFMETCFESDF